MSWASATKKSDYLSTQMVLKTVKTQQCESALTGITLRALQTCIQDAAALLNNTVPTAKAGDFCDGSLRSLTAPRHFFFFFDLSFLKLPLKAHDSLSTHFPFATAVVYAAKETIYEIGSVVAPSALLPS